MATRYKFEYNGNVYEVEGPENATPEQLIAAVSQPQPEPSSSWAAPPTAAGFGRAAGLLGRDVIEGAAGLAGIVTDPFTQSFGAIRGQRVATGREAGGHLADALGLPTPETGTERVISGVQQALTGVGAPGVIARAAQPVSTAGRAIAGAFTQNPVLQTASATTGAGAAGLAGEAGLGPTGQLVAGVAGSLAPGASAALAGTRNPQRRALLEFARQENIPVAGRQATDSPMVRNFSAAANESLPFTGAQRATERQQEAFNRALSRTFGDDLPDLSPQSMAAARADFQRKYAEVFQGNQINFDPRAVSGVNQILARAENALTRDQLDVLRRNADTIIREFGGGAIDGSRYQALRGELYGSAGGDKLGSFIKQLAGVVDDAAGRSLPAGSKEAFRKVNSQYNNFSIVRKALEQIRAIGGDVSPASLAGVLKQRGMDRATPEMRKLAELGQLVLKEQIGNPGTAQRLVGLGAPTAVGVGSLNGVDPAMLVGGTAIGGALSGTARFLNSPIGGRMVGLGLLPNAPRANRLAQLAAPYTVAAQNAQDQ